MRLATPLALLGYLLLVASENIVLIITDDQDLTLDGMVASFVPTLPEFTLTRRFAIEAIS